MSIGQDEEETKQWDRFWFSGSVEDYLRYKGCRQEEKQNEAYGGNGSREFSEDRDKANSLKTGYSAGKGRRPESWVQCRRRQAA